MIAAHILLASLDITWRLGDCIAPENHAPHLHQVMASDLHNQYPPLVPFNV